MGKVVNFKPNVPVADIGNMLIKMGETVRGKVRGCAAITITEDDGVLVVFGPDLDISLAAMAKLTAILGSVYTGDLETQ
jgi:hypothetical protein